MHACACFSIALSSRTGNDTSAACSHAVNGGFIGGESTERAGMLVQPLYAPHVRVSKGVYKNIMIIATEFNSVYGFDAGGCWLTHNLLSLLKIPP